MKTQRYWIYLIFGLMVGVIGLAGCGSQPEPIRVYVTPTPLPSPTISPVPSAEADSAQTVLAQGSIPETLMTPSPTPEPPPPGVTFGPITGPDYTPQPLATSLPDVLAEQPCRAMVTARVVDVYASPDKTAPIVLQRPTRHTFTIEGFATDSDGNQWAKTSDGWFMPSDGETELARITRVRRCDILAGITPDTTLLGLHVLNDSRSEDVLAFVRRMAFAGKPVGTVKGLTSTEAMLNEIKTVSPDTLIIYRTTETTKGPGDCPALPFENLPDPVMTARDWLAMVQPFWDQVDADYYEVLNECGAPPAWLAEFSLEMMRLANAQDRCLLLFSFPGGYPDMATFDTLLPVYKYAVENPCQDGRRHGVALHAYSLENDALVSEAGVWVAFRHRILRERLLLQLPEAADLPVMITEVGITGRTLMPTCETLIRDALQYTYQLEEDPYVLGFHLWGIGTGSQYYDITPCLSPLAEALLTYYDVSR